MRAITDRINQARIIYHQWRIESLARVIRELKENKGQSEINDEDVLFFNGKMMAHIYKIRDLRGGYNGDSRMQEM